MSTAGALHHLTIRADSPLPRATIKYFLQHVRSLQHLEFAPDVKWSAQSLPLLATLAPRSLTLSRGFLNKSVHQMLKDYASTPHASLKQVVGFLNKDGFVNFSSLLPSLESLILKDEQAKIVCDIPISSESLEWFARTLPPTLTHLTLPAARDVHPHRWITLLPKTLVSLTLDLNEVYLSSIFDRLPQIEKLSLSANWAPSSTEIGATTLSVPINIPQSLSKLILLQRSAKLNCVLDGSLRRSNVRFCTLNSWYLNPNYSQVDLSALLPPHLESLALRGEVDDIHGTLPPSLTSFEYMCPSLPIEFNQLLQPLTTLKSLKLIPEKIVSHFWPCFKLDLPRSLQFFSAPLQLSEVVSIRRSHPNCFVESVIGLDLSSPDLDEMIRSDPLLLAFTEPTFDFPRLNAAIVAKLYNRVRFRYKEPLANRKSETRPLWTSSKRIIVTEDHFYPLTDLNSIFPCAEDASLSCYHSAVLPSKLTKLDFNNTPLNNHQSLLFPSTLTYLASNALVLSETSDRHSEGSFKLKYLNIPRWTLTWSDRLAASPEPDMEKLYIGTIEDIPDWRIIPFLAQFSSKTLRQKTFIKLMEYIPTGTVTEWLISLPKKYNFEIMVSFTHQLLCAKLEALKFLRLRPSPDCTSTYLVIPTHPDIEVLHLLTRDIWQPLAPRDWKTDAEELDQLNTPQALSILQSHNLKEFVLAFSHLDQLTFPTIWPSSLVRIGLDSLVLADFRFVSFPSSLEVLSLRTFEKSPELGFSIHILPVSLKKLTIQSSGPWSQNAAQSAPSGSSYNLSLARFTGMADDALFYIFEALSLSNCKIEVREKDRFVQRSNKAPHNLVIAPTDQKWTHLD